MYKYKKIFTLILTTLVLGSFQVQIFAQDLSKNVINVKLDSRYTEEICLKYPNAISIEFISNNKDTYYFRVFEKKGDMNYKLVRCTIDDTIKVDELKWIWAKEYNSEIRTIEYKMLETGAVTAKVYLRNGEIVDEKIVFTDSVNNYHFVEVIQ